MARTIDEILNTMIEEKEKHSSLRGLSRSASAIWMLLFYIVAVGHWTLEKLFDSFRKTVENMLSLLKPHRAKWYRDKTLLFQKDYSLPVDSDTYEIIDKDACVVKYAAAVEALDASILMIKVAGEKGGLRSKLDTDTEKQLSSYLQWIKDAGVRISLINKDADYFKCEIDIYYNPMLIPDNVRSNIRIAINDYIENLDFNGEYSNMTLVDRVQVLDGVMVVGTLSAFSRPASDDYNLALINAKKIPDAGYFRAYDEADIQINMIPYELAQD